MSACPQLAVSLTDKQKYRKQLCAEVDGLRRQVEELRQHVQNNPNQVPPDQQHFMAQLQGKRGLNPQHAQQFSQQQHRINIMNSLSGQDMRHHSQGMSSGASSIPNQSGLSDDMLSERLLQRKQAELNEIIEQQRKLYTNLDSLDRQRSQILGDMDKTAAFNFHLQGQTTAGRFPSQTQLRTGLSQTLPSHFSPPHMHPGHQMRPPSNNVGFPSSTMQFLSNRKGFNSKSELPPSLMESDFGNMPNGFPPKTSAGTLGSFRGRYEAKLQEMEGNMNPNDTSHIEKRRRFMASNGLPETQKQQLGRLSAKNFNDNRISSSFLPSEIMVSPKNAGDSLSVLSSSHQLLMSQREANMQRETQNMMFFQGMSNGRNLNFPGMNRTQPQHDGKLPETKRKLSKDFTPEADTVVLGKGNIPKTNIGNLKLKGIVMDNLIEYANGERRKKIAVISRIITRVTNNNYKTTGFVKYEDDCWYEMTERDARVKITALFRDCLHDQYRSSSSSKVKRRQELRKSRSLATTEAAATGEKSKNEADSSSSTTNGAEKPSNGNTSTSEGQNATLKRKNIECL